jgi:phage FluMu gp28-like protein
MQIHIPTPEADRVAEVLSHDFLPYQEAWINDESRRKLAQKTRRCGLTFAEEFRRVERICKQGARYDAYITSKDEGLAKQFIRESKEFADRFKLAGTIAGEELFGEGKASATAYTLQAATGRRIYSLSSNPDQQAGRAGDRTADEFALHKEQLELFKIMKPGTMWGGQISIFSTHRGVGSYFNQLIKEVTEKGNPKKFSLHTITITDAVAQGLWIKIRDQLPEDDEQKHFTDDDFLQSCRDEMPDEESFLQEFMCVPEDDGASFIPWSMIVPCSSKLHMGIDWRTLPGPFYAGYDVARKKDLSVITLYHQVGGQLIQCADIHLTKQTFTQQQKALHSILDDSRVKRCCIDATGIGAMIAEQAHEKYKSKVQQVTFNMGSKHELAWPMRQRFEDRTVTIFDDMKLHADLRSVKTETTSAGNIIFTAEAGVSDGHADRFWSHALAIMAADGAVGTVLWQRIKHLMGRRSDTRAQDRRARGAFA